MCRDITIYSVPGPSSAPAILRDEIVGGWAYAIENLWFLSELNPNCEIEVVFGHVIEFGLVPKIPKIPRVSVQVFETSLYELSPNAHLLAGEQHGAILNYVLRSHVLKTPFYAVLDPDCYIVTKNSFHKLMLEMTKSDLDVFGVSYPSTLPKSYYWDFPTAYFQIMNSSNCKPEELDFLPEYKTPKSSSADAHDKKKTLDDFIMLAMKISRKFKFPLKNLFWRLQESSNLLAQLMFYFSTNFMYRNSELFKDTGWRNRERFGELNFRIIPHRINPSKMSIGFDEGSYLKNNVDVKNSSLNPTWHAMMHGIYERRDFGNQRFLWRHVRGFVQGRGLDSKTFPATSITMEYSFLSKIQIHEGWGNMKYAYEYFWEGEPFCIHLGHGGKENVRIDISRLARIRHQITNGGLIWRKNEFN